MSEQAKPAQPVPPPGSPKARADGCTCPAGANHNGNGFHSPADLTSKPYFVINIWCPLHAKMDF